MNKKYSTVEKEAYAIAWTENLLNCIPLYTAEITVAFMFDTKHTIKIKNDKILRWLSLFDTVLT